MSSRISHNTLQNKDFFEERLLTFGEPLPRFLPKVIAIEEDMFGTERGDVFEPFWRHGSSFGLKLVHNRYRIDSVGPNCPPSALTGQIDLIA